MRPWTSVLCSAPPGSWVHIWLQRQTEGELSLALHICVGKVLNCGFLKVDVALNNPVVKGEKVSKIWGGRGLPRGQGGGQSPLGDDQGWNCICFDFRYCDLLKLILNTLIWKSMKVKFCLVLFWWHWKIFDYIGNKSLMKVKFHGGALAFSGWNYCI